MDRVLAPVSCTACNANGNIEAPPDGLAHDFLLVLRLDSLHFQISAAVTVCGRRYRYDLVDMVGNCLAVSFPITGTRFAAGLFGVGFRCTARKQCRLALVGPLCVIQLSLELFVFLSESLLFPFQSLPFLFQLFFSILKLSLAPPQAFICLP